MAWPQLDHGGAWPEPQYPSELTQAPAGYVQAVTGASVRSPVLAQNDPASTASLRDSGLSADAIGAGKMPLYIPAWYGDGRLGRRPGGFAIGRGAIGHLRPYHNRLELLSSTAAIGDFAIGFSPIQGDQLGYTEIKG